MDFVMYTCPECRKVFKVKGNGKKVRCSKCADSYLKDLRITPEEWGELDANAKKRCIENAISEQAISGSSTAESLPHASDNVTPVKSSHINIPGAVFKCKMCGGRLEVQENESVCTCEYCGIRQTLPKLDDERKINLYDRANHFRRNNDYDKAMSIYEQILNEDRSDAESYWSLVLCRYGIEYVEDPTTHTRKPTVNRAQYTSIYEDEDYKSAIKYADTLQKSIYEREANVINEIQKGILAISSKEAPFDVFICYKETDDNGSRTPDSVLANDLYHQLTQEGFKVFFSRITLEDKLGQEYEPYIFAALNSAKVMVVLGTKPDHFNAIWVKNEWSRYLALIKKDHNKTLVPAYKDMDPYDLPEEFSHLQAQDMSKLGFMQDLIRGIKKIVATDHERSIDKTSVTIQQGLGNAEALLQRGFIALEDKEWKTANVFFENVLNIDAKCSFAYLGKAMAEYGIEKKENILDHIFRIQESKNYQRAVRFGDHEFKNEIYGTIYNRASDYLHKGKFNKAIKYFGLISGFRDSDIALSKCRKELDAVTKRLEEKRLESLRLKKRIVSSQYYAIGVNDIGIIYASGDNFAGRLNVKGWKDIIEISGPVNHTVGLCKDGTVIAAGDNKIGQCNVGDWKNIVSVSAGNGHTLGLLDNGTVVATGDNGEKQCSIDSWDNIIAISTGYSRSIGLKKDGTVIATGNNVGKAGRGACDVGGWENIVEISTGGNHTLGLCSDGTVEATGSNTDGQCDVDEWKNIISVSAGFNHSVGLCADGTVVAVGNNERGQCEVNEWIDIIAINASSSSSTIGMKSDGTIVMTKTDESCGVDTHDWKLMLSNDDIYKLACEYINREQYSRAIRYLERIKDYKKAENELERCRNLVESKRNKSWAFMKQMLCGTDYVAAVRSDGRVLAKGLNTNGRLDVTGWKEIVEIDSGGKHTVGLRKDGTLVAVGDNKYGQCDVGSWKNIIAISAGSEHTIGLLKNGTVVSTGRNKYGECNVDDWERIIAVSAGGYRSIGLREDGTVVAIGKKEVEYGTDPCDVDNWKGIIELSAGQDVTVGLRSDGIAVFRGDEGADGCDIACDPEYKYDPDYEYDHEYISVAAGSYHCVGLRMDGTVFDPGFSAPNEWTDIIAVKAGDGCTMGLKSDGTLELDIHEDGYSIDVSNWNLFSVDDNVFSQEIYSRACAYMDKRDYEKAIEDFREIPGYKDADLLLNDCIKETCRVVK